MQAIDNSAVLFYPRILGYGITGKAAFSYSEGGKTITVTDESTITDPAQSFKVAHVEVYDYFGNKRSAEINALHGSVVVNLAAFSKPLAKINITNGGNYSVVPTAVTFTGGGGTGAAATPVLNQDGTLSLIITNYGKDYSSAPTVGLTGGTGSGFAATAIVSAASFPEMNPQRGYAVQIAVVTNKGNVKDGTAYKIANTQTNGEFVMER